MASFLDRTIRKISSLHRGLSTDDEAQAEGDPNRGNGAHRSAARPREERSFGNRQTHLRDVDWLPAERRRQKFIDLYLFAVDASLRGGADRWWQRAFGYDRLPDPEQGVESLKDFCLHHLLYEAGDVAACRRVYEILDEEGQLEGDDRGRFLLKLTQYLDHTLRSVGQLIAWQDPDTSPPPPPPPSPKKESLLLKLAQPLNRTLQNVKG